MPLPVALVGRGWPWRFCCSRIWLRLVATTKRWCRGLVRKVGGAYPLNYCCCCCCCCCWSRKVYCLHQRNKKISYRHMSSLETNISGKMESSDLLLEGEYAQARYWSHAIVGIPLATQGHLQTSTSGAGWAAVKEFSISSLPTS